MFCNDNELVQKYISTAISVVNKLFPPADAKQTCRLSQLNTKLKAVKINQVGI
jgi:hypothetical protein